MNRTEYISFIFSHIALFIIFVWFGALKLFGLSPAGPLVTDLFNQTLGAVLPFMSADMFIVILGGVEVLIGVLFIIPRFERVAIALLIPHMITTIMPLILLPSVTWSGFFSPTLEGQYIIKNIIIIALAASVFADRGKQRVRA